MVAVLIDGPLREQNVRVFRIEQFAEGGILFSIDDGLAVVLAGKERSGFEDLARLVCFGSANLATTVAVTLTVAISLAMVEIEQSGIVAEGGVACNRAGAAAFRITRMTAGDD